MRKPAHVVASPKERVPMQAEELEKLIFRTIEMRAESKLSSEPCNAISPYYLKRLIVYASCVVPLVTSFSGARHKAFNLTEIKILG